MKIFRLFSALFWAIPFYFIWNSLAPIYAPQLPPQYLDVPYWHIAGVFALIAILNIVIRPGHGGRRFKKHYGWQDGPHRFGKYAKYCQRGYWTEKYYHRT